MAAVKHVFSNAIADGTNNSIVRPSDWNSGHNQLWTLSGNTSLSSTASGTNIILSANTQGINTLIGSSDTIVVSSPNLMQVYAPDWNLSGVATNSSLGQGTLYFQPFEVAYPISGSRINFYVSFSGALSAGNSTGTCAAAIGYGLYTRDGNGTASSNINLLTSYQATVLSQSFTSNTAYNVTYYAGLSNATSHTTASTGISNANASTYQATNINGIRVIAMPLNVSMTPGRYWLGFSNTTVTGNGMTNNMSVLITQNTLPYPQINWLGFASAATNASVFQMAGVQGWGSYSATSAAWPAAIAFTTDNIRAAVGAQTLVHFDICGYSTSTNIA